MSGRNANGEGTIYRRKDGRWDASAYLLTTSGLPKRRHFYGKTRKEAHDKLLAAQSQVSQGVPLPDRSWKLGEYLEYWLENVIRPTKRPATYEQYTWIASRTLKPDLGHISLQQLSVPKVQIYLNSRKSTGDSPHRIRLIRMVLGAALARAQREEIITRNVARLVDVPAYEPIERHPWSIDEAQTFYAQAKDNPLYPAFVLLQVYGLRRGEVLGLRWGDIDADNMIIRIRNQLQRGTAGQLRQGPVKTKAGNRDLRLIEPVYNILQELRREQAAHLGTNMDAPATQLVFTREDGRPLDPDSFTTSFQRLCRRYGVRVIRVHDIRHTTATMMADRGVGEKNIQSVLGQSDLATTRHYVHQKIDNVEAINTVARLFLRRVGTRCRQPLPSTTIIVERLTSFKQWYTRQDSNLRPLVPELSSGHREERVTEVERLVGGWRSAWLLGLVAVSVAVKVSYDELLAAAP